VPGYPLPAREVIDATYQHAVLHSDCRAIGEVQRRFAAALRSGEVHVTTPAGTDLRFRAGDRPVNLQDGDASAARARQAQVLIDREIEIPCGAIRVAPLEETVEGTIAFPPSRWADRDVEGLVVHIAKGRIASAMTHQAQSEILTRQLAGREVSHLAATDGQNLGIHFTDGTALLIESSEEGLSIAIRQPVPSQPTQRQSEYLRFIAKYIRQFGRSPAESDIQRHFLVSAPTVNQMMQTLERRGFITRQPRRGAIDPVVRKRSRLRRGVLVLRLGPQTG